MTVEKLNAAEEEIEIQIVEDPPEGGAVSSDDELERYTKSVSRRINKLNQKTKQAEERSQYLESLALQKDKEIDAYKKHTLVQQTTVLQKEQEALLSKESQVDDIYRKAIRSGDADLISKADTLKTDIAIQKEKLRVAQSNQSRYLDQQRGSQENYQAYQQPQEQQVKPTSEALSWHDQNKWYGDSESEENLQATQFAYFTHFNLINEGFEPDSEEYYNELDTRVFRIYPTLKGSSVAEKKEDRPAVQRVASASSAGRQQTQGSKRGVKFTRSELQRLHGLKPHNMSEENWLMRVAAEKQKIAQREARQ
jgi:hypothetical protein